MKCSHGISNFLEEISSLSHSVVSYHDIKNMAFRVKQTMIRVSTSVQYFTQFSVSSIIRWGWITVGVCAQSLSCVQLFATPRTVAHQDPPSMKFAKQEHWNGLPFPPLGIFLTQESNPGLPHCRQTLPSEPPGKPIFPILLFSSVSLH